MKQPDESPPALVDLRLQDGDVLLLKEPGGLIARLSQGDYSHAGIASDGSEHQVVDADNRGGASQDVREQSVSEFCGSRPGRASRFDGDTEIARKASQWAKEMVGRVKFCLHDPMIGPDGTISDSLEKMYCSEFVWRCYWEGAGVELVPEDDFLELSAADVRERLSGDHEKTRGLFARLIESGRHNGVFVSPKNLADSSYLVEVTK